MLSWWQWSNGQWWQCSRGDKVRQHHWIICQYKRGPQSSTNCWDRLPLLPTALYCSTIHCPLLIILNIPSPHFRALFLHSLKKRNLILIGTTTKISCYLLLLPEKYEQISLSWQYRSMLSNHPNLRGTVPIRPHVSLLRDRRNVQLITCEMNKSGVAAKYCFFPIS